MKSGLIRALLLVGVGVLFAPAAAQACSCIPADGPKDQARAVLEYSDAAFIGQLVSVRELDDGADDDDPVLVPSDAIFRYRVKRSFGESLGRFVRVRSNTSGATCGLGTKRGRTIALGIAGEQGDWSGSLCSYVDPKALRKVAPKALLASAEAGTGCGADA